MVNKGTDTNELTVYEIGYLILPSIAEDKLDGVVDSIKKVIDKEGGVELESETPFKHDLAYNMFKTIGASRYVLSDAYIGWIKFEAEGSKVEVMKAKIEKIDEVLRFLIVKTPRKTTFTFAQAKAAIKAKEDLENGVTEEVTAPIEGVVVE